MISLHEARIAASAASGRYGSARRDGHPADVIARKASDLTAARVQLRIVEVLTDAPPISPEGKARLLALIDSAPTTDDVAVEVLTPADDVDVEVLTA